MKVIEQHQPDGNKKFRVEIQLSPSTSWGFTWPALNRALAASLHEVAARFGGGVDAGSLTGFVTHSSRSEAVRLAKKLHGSWQGLLDNVVLVSKTLEALKLQQ